MNIFSKFFILLLVNFFVFVKAMNNDSATRIKPHIVLIIADDMGWNDVSFHGAKQIPTPNIDSLAYNGVILNRHYVLSSCTPSRTSLMTGRYLIREGMQGRALRAGEPRGIPLNSTLMPEYFRELGYSTHLVGKWHLGYTTKDYTPTSRGFDTFFGHYSGLITYHNYSTLYSRRGISPRFAYDLHRDTPEGLGVANGSQYFTDLITKEAEEIIKNNDNKVPLFLEIAHLAGHMSQNRNPLEVRNLTKVHDTFSYIRDVDRRKYAGMIKAMDESVGRVVTTLSKAKMLNNSIIVFMSDNGAPTIGYDRNSGSNHPFRGIKNTILEGGVRGVACIFSPLIKARNRVSLDLMHISDWLPTLYSAAGGNLDNLQQPIDGINQWSTIVNGDKTKRTSVLLNIGNNLKGAIMNTYKLIKGKAYTNSYLGERGTDKLFPVYRNVLSSPAARAIAKLQGFNNSHLSLKIRELRSQSTVHCGRSKLIPRCSTCLFDLENDPCETEDLSRALPQIVRQLNEFLDSYENASIPERSTDVDPCADPLYFNNILMPWRISDEASTHISFNSSNVCNHPNYNFVSLP